MVSNFLKTHERLIIIVLVLAVLGFLTHEYLTHAAAVDDKKAQQADQVLQQQKTVNDQLAVQVKSQEDVLTQLVAQVSQENAQLIAAIQNRTQATVVQQVKDKTLPIPDLVTRWNGLAALPASDITNTTAGLIITEDGARQTVSQLELVPTLQQNLSDSQTIISNKDDQITAQNNLTSGLQSQVVGLNTQITDADKACKAQIASVKATARKSKLKWLFYGIGIGIGGTVALVVHGI